MRDELPRRDLILTGRGDDEEVGLGKYVLLIFILAGCTSGPAPDNGRPVSPLSGCGSGWAHSGARPAWTDEANPGDLRYVLSAEGNAAGFLFADPPHAGPGATNKILWVVREPRNQQPLRITATPEGASAPVVHAEFPADSGPGQIYPSGVDLPTPGCWRFTLTWGVNRATVDVLYVA